MRINFFTGLIFLILCSLLVISTTTLPSISGPRSLPQFDYTIERIWNGSSTCTYCFTTIAHSGDYLYLLNGSKEIIMFEQEQEKAIYESNDSIWGIVALNDTVIFPQTYSVVAVSFENQSNPKIISRVQNSHVGARYRSMSYNDYVYVGTYEWGFQIFDFSNLTSPRHVGLVFPGTYHSVQPYRLSNHGLFLGDLQSWLSNLEPDPSNPLLVKAWSRHDPNLDYNILGAGLERGKPAASSQFFVINIKFRETFNSTKIGMFYIIPRENATTIGTPFNITYSLEKSYTHLALINDNILVVSDENNTISIFEITENNIMSSLAEISLGDQGSIEDFYHVENTTIIYIADGSNGLLKLILELDFESGDGLTIVFAEPIFLLVTIVVLAIFRLRRKTIK